MHSAICLHRGRHHSCLSDSRLFFVSIDLWTGANILNVAIVNDVATLLFVFMDKFIRRMIRMDDRMHFVLLL